MKKIIQVFILILMITNITYAKTSNMFKSTSYKKTTGSTLEERDKKRLKKIKKAKKGNVDDYMGAIQAYLEHEEDLKKEEGVKVIDYDNQKIIDYADEGNVRDPLKKLAFYNHTRYYKGNFLEDVRIASEKLISTNDDSKLQIYTYYFKILAKGHFMYWRDTNYTVENVYSSIRKKFRDNFIYDTIFFNNGTLSYLIMVYKNKEDFLVNKNQISSFGAEVDISYNTYGQEVYLKNNGNCYYRESGKEYQNLDAMEYIVYTMQHQ